jgi:hypothetical protein
MNWHRRRVTPAPGSFLVNVMWLGAVLLLPGGPSVATEINICMTADGSAVVSDVPCPADSRETDAGGQADLQHHLNRMVMLCAAPQFMTWLKAQQSVDNQSRNAKLGEFVDGCRRGFGSPVAVANPEGRGQSNTPGVPPFTQPVEFAKDPTVLQRQRSGAPSSSRGSAASEVAEPVVHYGAKPGLAQLDRSATFKEPDGPVIFDLGRLSGGRNSSYASGISADGKLVVGEANHGNYSQVPFTWTPESGMVSLDQSFLRRPFGGARAVNSDGSVIVGEWDPAGTGRSQAFRWTKKTGIITLGVLPGADRSTATAVSADGRVVVGKSEGAFRWTARTGMVALPGGLTTFGATAVSADGRMVFGDESGPDGNHVIRWDEDGTITLYAKPLGAFGASVQAVTPDASIAVGNYTFLIGKNFQTQAAVWYSQTHLVSLGFLHGGNFSKATADSMHAGR